MRMVRSRQAPCDHSFPGVCGFPDWYYPRHCHRSGHGRVRNRQADPRSCCGSTYPIPKLSIFPLLMMIFGIGELSKIMAIAIGCFFLVLINSMAGVRNINKGYFEVAKNYGANNRHLFTRVYSRRAFPWFLPVSGLLWEHH